MTAQKHFIGKRYRQIIWEKLLYFQRSSAYVFLLNILKYIYNFYSRKPYVLLTLLVEYVWIKVDANKQSLISGTYRNMDIP